mgnify:CR=1 FL=1
MANDLVPQDPKEVALRVKQQKEIRYHQNRAIVPALKQIANEVEERAKSGKLKKELSKLKSSKDTSEDVLFTSPPKTTHRRILTTARSINKERKIDKILTPLSFKCNVISKGLFMHELNISII